MYRFLFFVVFAALCLCSCQEEEGSPVASTGHVIIVNEGNFGSGNGSISLYNPEEETVTNSIFDQVNGELGASVQSVSLYQDRIYILCNAADKIEAVDADTFERLAPPLSGDSLITPRYMTIAGNKGYVSVWGPYEEDYSLKNSRVAVIDLASFTITKVIDTQAGPEGILAVGDKVFVANSFSNTLTVIDTRTDAVDTTLEIAAGPAQLALDSKQQLWVSATGGFEGSPRFIGIDPETYAVKAEVEVAQASGRFTMNADRDSVFYLSNAPYPATESAVYAFGVSAPAIPGSALIEGNDFYGIGIDPASNILYLGDANAFQAAGTVLRYQTSGTLIDDIAVGVGPNGFVFH